MAAAGFTVVYVMGYRGTTEEYSQQYHIADSWTDDADRTATADAFATAVKPLFDTSSAVSRFYFYDNTDDHSTLTYDLLALGVPVYGTLGVGSSVAAPGDCAFWARWKTSRVNSNGKAIYLRKYWHGVRVGGTDATDDTIYSTQKTSTATFATNARTTGWHSHLIAGPDGVTPPGPELASTFSTTRTLKRRGKRP